MQMPMPMPMPMKASLTPYRQGIGVDGQEVDDALVAGRRG